MTANLKPQKAMRRKPAPLLTVEYLEKHGLYLIIPVLDRAECEQEYLFSDYLDAKQFIEAWQCNATAAHFAYEIKERNIL